jgi:hypothetical protein
MSLSCPASRHSLRSWTQFHKFLLTPLGYVCEWYSRTLHDFSFNRWLIICILMTSYPKVGHHTYQITGTSSSNVHLLSDVIQTINESEIVARVILNFRPRYSATPPACVVWLPCHQFQPVFSNLLNCTLSAHRGRSPSTGLLPFDSVHQESMLSLTVFNHGCCWLTLSHDTTLASTIMPTISSSVASLPYCIITYLGEAACQMLSTNAIHQIPVPRR